MHKKPKVHHLSFAKDLGCLKVINYWWLNCVVQPLAMALPDIKTAIEANVPAEGSTYEVIHIANVLFSNPIHTYCQDQFVLYVMGCNSPLMSFHKAMSWKKSYFQMEHYPSTILMTSSQLAQTRV